MHDETDRHYTQAELHRAMTRRVEAERVARDRILRAEERWSERYCLRSELDRAIETRENANAATRRVEAERDRLLAEVEWRRHVMCEAKTALACGDGDAGMDALTRHEREGYPWAPGVSSNAGPYAARESTTPTTTED